MSAFSHFYLRSDWIRLLYAKANDRGRHNLKEFLKTLMDLEMLVVIEDLEKDLEK